MLQGTSSTQPEISCHIMQVFNSVSKITGTDTITVVLQPTFSWISKEQLLSRWCKTSWLVQNSSQGFRGCQSRCATGYCGRDLCLWHWNSSWRHRDTRLQLWGYRLFLPLQKQVLDHPRGKTIWCEIASEDISQGADQWKEKSTEKRVQGK